MSVTNLRELKGLFCRIDNFGIERPIEGSVKTSYIVEAISELETHVREKHCGTCKHCKKVFDGVHSETWSCTELNKWVSILGIPIPAKQLRKLRFVVKYGFVCPKWEK